MQTEVELVPLQQPAHLPGPQGPEVMPEPPPAPRQEKSTQVPVPQATQAAPFCPQDATDALLGEVTHLPEEQQPWQLPGPQEDGGGSAEHEGPPASINPTANPARRGVRRWREVISDESKIPANLR